jgi:hypothetical protein
MDLLDNYCEERSYPGGTHPANDGTTPTGRATTLLLAGLSAPKTFSPKMVRKKTIKNLHIAEILLFNRKVNM